MNTNTRATANPNQYQVPSLRMDVDRFIVPTVTIFIALLLFFFMLFPLWHILQLSFFKGGELGIANFTLENFQKYFTTGYTLRALWHSLYVSIVTTVIVTVIVFFFAYAMTRTTIRGKTFFRNIIMMPLVAPSIVQALALIYLFGRNGLISAHLLQSEWNIYGPVGIIISEVLYCLPHAYVILFTTLSAVDIRLDEAAESLGATPFKVFTRITLPSAKYGIFSAAALTFNLTITDFGNPVVIGGNYNVLATEIYAQVTNLYRFDLGATISIILLVPSPDGLHVELLYFTQDLFHDQRRGQTGHPAVQTVQKGGLHVLLRPGVLFDHRRIRHRRTRLLCQDMAL